MENSRRAGLGSSSVRLCGVTVCLRTWTRRIVPALLLLGVAGCNIHNRYVRLDYDYLRRKPGVTQRATVVVRPFQDARENKRIGKIYRRDNVIGRAYAKNSVAEWVRYAMTMELTSNGFAVAEPPPEDNEDTAEPAFTIAGEVIEVTALLMDALTTRIQVRVTAEADGKTFLSRTYTESDGMIPLWGTPEEFNAALNRCLSRLLNDVILDVKIYRPRHGRR